MDLEIYNHLKNIRNFNFDHRTNILKLENHIVTIHKKFAFESKNKRMGVIVE